MYLTDKQLKNWGKKRKRKAEKIKRQYREDKKDYARVVKKLGPRPTYSAHWAEVWDFSFNNPIA